MPTLTVSPPRQSKAHRVVTSGKNVAKQQALKETPRSRLFIELFAGIGLVHEALNPLGWTAVMANDNDPKKQAGYAANFPTVPFDARDVRELDLCECGVVDLVTASFPCIDLSQAGNRQGIEGVHSGLVRTFLEKIGTLRDAGKMPEFLFIENVPNLLSIHEGAAIDEILHTLAALGYGFDVVQVDARHFTPQSRNRVFIIAADAARHPPPPIPLPSDNLHRHKVQHVYARTIRLPWHFFPFPPLPLLTLKLEEILDSVATEDAAWWDDKRMAYFWELLEDEHVEHLRALLAAGGTHTFTAVRRLRRRRKREQIFNIRFDGLASCLRTPRGGSSTQFVVQVCAGTVRVRRLSGRESARLQGVSLPGLSPDFQLMGTENDLRFAYGDAVCVPAVRWVMQHSIETLCQPTSCQGHWQGLQQMMVFE